MNCKDARFMLTFFKRRGGKEKTVPLIFGQLRCNYIGARLIGGLALDETSVYI